MNDYIPNNVFMGINPEMEKEMNEIKAERDSLIEKYKDVFKDESVFINLKFSGFIQQKDKTDSLPFNIEYSDNLPTHIKQEFEDYLKKLR